jgi:hypothetical protein
MPKEFPSTEIEIDEFLAAFEAGKLPKERWTHAAHLAAGASYVYMLGRDAATEHIRVCIPRHNESVGTQNTESSGYHETITVFWVRVLAQLHDSREWESRSEFVRAAVEQFAGQRSLFREYYSFDLVGSTEARRRWIAPDSQPLD